MLTWCSIKKKNIKLFVWSSRLCLSIAFSLSRLMEKSTKKKKRRCSAWRSPDSLAHPLRSVAVAVAVSRVVSPAGGALVAPQRHRAVGQHRHALGDAPAGGPTETRQRDTRIRDARDGKQSCKDGVIMSDLGGFSIGSLCAQNKGSQLFGE